MSSVYAEMYICVERLVVFFWFFFLIKGVDQDVPATEEPEDDAAAAVAHKGDSEASG